MEAGLLTGAALGLSVAAPFGPVSLICVQQSLNRGYRYGVISGFGAATSQGIFATAAIISAGSVSVAMMPWSSTIRLLSAVVLVCLGIWTILRARSVPTPAGLVSMRKAYASTLLLSLSNPMTVIPYLAFATVVAEGRMGNAALSLWSVPGVIVAAGTWYACLSLVTSIMRSSISPGMIRFLNLAAGSALIIFGLIVGRQLLAL